MDERQMYSEVYAVLLALGDESVSKIPEEVFEVIKDMSDEALMPKIDENKGIDEQGLSKDGMALLAALNLNYWCETEEEKKEFEEYLKANEQEIKDIMMATNSLRERLHMIKDNK